MAIMAARKKRKVATRLILAGRLNVWPGVCLLFRFAADQNGRRYHCQYQEGVEYSAVLQHRKTSFIFSLTLYIHTAGISSIYFLNF
jgi:hypothetical protein